MFFEVWDKGLIRLTLKFENRSGHRTGRGPYCVCRELTKTGASTPCGTLDSSVYLDDASC